MPTDPKNKGAFTMIELLAVSPRGWKDNRPGL